MTEPLRIETAPDTGITNEQAAMRKAQGLINAEPPSISKSTGLIWREHVFTFFNAINLAIFVALILVNSYTNLTFMVVVLSNLLIGVTQEIRSKRMVERLSLLHTRTVTLVRGGDEISLPGEQLVLDDVIILRLGDQIPTDSILLEGAIEVDESLLTGESKWLKKGAGDYLLSGSAVMSGSCRARVERVGKSNYATSIAMEARKPARIDSKLMRSLRVIIRYAGGVVVPLGLLLFARAYIEIDHSLQSSVEQAAASMIGMIPSGLMLLTSMTLSVGVMRLSKKHMLVQEPYAIETLARADILCLDKTGTLTTGRMTVAEVCPLEGNTHDEADRLLYGLVNALSADNTTSKAFLDYFSRDAGGKTKNCEPPCGVTPFSSARRYSAAAFSTHTVYIGAPDSVCISKLSEAQKSELNSHAEEGYRVLLLAKGEGERAGAEPPPPNEREPEPVAFILLLDEIRPEAKSVLRFFRDEGVDIKLISGDDPRTVARIAERLELEGCMSCVDVSSLEDDNAVMEAAGKYTVFGRVSPHEKRLILKTLQKEGHTVAMTGDGVNDILALREADCGIALHTGSAAARQASHMVMLTDDFAALPNVVMEGRRVINNITRMASLFLVKTSYSFLLTMGSVLLSISYPFQPIQLSFISSFTVGIPSFFLAMGPNRTKISGSFINSVLSRAIPAGLIVFLYALIASIEGPKHGLNYAEINTLCVYLTGTAMLIVLLRVSLPLDRWRSILWFSMASLFFTSTLLFSELLGIIIPDSTPMGIMFGVMAACCYPLLSLLTRVVKRIMCRGGL